jgi:CRISPR-associated protein Cmr3
VSGWQAFQLVADDVLFFRDGKPSTRGADHYLRSLFPPRPSTLYGAVRTRRLLDEGVELSGLREPTWAGRLGEKLVGELGPWGGFGSLELRGPWLLHEEKGPLLPAPHDLGVVIAKDEPGEKGEPAGPPRAGKVVRYRPDLTEQAGGWSHPLAPMAPFEEDGSPWEGGPGTEPRAATGWFVTPAGLATWRSGGVPAPGELLHPRALWLDEARTGVGLEADRRHSKEGLLYTFGFIRLERGVSLGFEVSGSTLEPGGRVRLGGEGRTAALETGEAFPAAGDLPATGGLISLCFSTPALSESGAWPPGFAPEAAASNGAIRGTLGGRRLRLVAAAVQGYTTVGGWDVAKNYPKPLRRALPAGSVFLFEPEDGAGPLDFDGQRFSDFSGEHLSRQGFGLAVAGLSA